MGTFEFIDMLPGTQDEHQKYTSGLLEYCSSVAFLFYCLLYILISIKDSTNPEIFMCGGAKNRTFIRCVQGDANKRKQQLIKVIYSYEHHNFISSMEIHKLLFI